MQPCKCGSFAINENAHGRKAGKHPKLCDVCYWRDEYKRLVLELNFQRDLWASNPAGVDDCASINDESPADDMQWRSGIAIKSIDAALST